MHIRTSIVRQICCNASWLCEGSSARLAICYLSLQSQALHEKRLDPGSYCCFCRADCYFPEVLGCMRFRHSLAACSVPGALCWRLGFWHQVRGSVKIFLLECHAKLAWDCTPCMSKMLPEYLLQFAPVAYSQRASTISASAMPL